jgi:hypothetical protein
LFVRHKFPCSFYLVGYVHISDEPVLPVVSINELTKKKRPRERFGAVFQKLPGWLTSATAAAIAPATAAITAAAATTTVASASSAAAVAAATATIASAATAAAAGRTLFTRARFIHSQRSTVDTLAVEFGNGSLRVLFRGHCDKGEAAGFPGEFVLHQHYLLDGACL